MTQSPGRRLLVAKGASLQYADFYLMLKLSLVRICKTEMGVEVWEKPYNCSFMAKMSWAMLGIPCGLHEYRGLW